MRSWYENGQLKREGIFFGLKKNGLHRHWHKNGQLSNEINFVNLKAEGLRRSWHENGQLSTEGNFVNKTWPIKSLAFIFEILCFIILHSFLLLYS